LTLKTRRQFLTQSAAAAAGTFWSPRTLFAAPPGGPSIEFPGTARERLSVASYPFREFIAGPGEAISSGKIDLKDFAAHVSENFQINKIEPWSRHFHSLDAAYLAGFRASVEKSHAQIVNIAVDGDQSPYSLDRKNRQAAVAYARKWVDIAVAVGSPSIRTHIASAKDSRPDVDRAAESLGQVAEYGAQKNVVINLENDDATSEDPFFVARVIEKAGSPWLRALPDFANSLAIATDDYNDRGFAAMCSHAYNICHVKEVEDGEKGRVYHVDLAKAFAILKRSNYRGFLSMEWDSAGDPHEGTKSLIAKTLEHLG